MMNKVYIVTEGSYSDYHIKKVFVDKEKAELYARFSSDSSVEEWEISDEKEVKYFHFVSVWYEVENTTKQEKYNFSIEKTNTLDVNENEIDTIYWGKYNESYRNSSAKGQYIRLTRVIPNQLILDKNGEIDWGKYNELEQKYLKVCRDIYAEIQSLIESENWNEEMVDEWLKTKTETVKL